MKSAAGRLWRISAGTRSFRSSEGRATARSLAMQQGCCSILARSTSARVPRIHIRYISTNRSLTRSPRGLRAPKGPNVSQRTSSTSSQGFSDAGCHLWRAVSSGTSFKPRPLLPTITGRQSSGQRSYREFIRDTEPTIYALSTAPGRAAIAIIRISGEACLDVYRSLCPAKADPKPRYATLRTLFDTAAESSEVRDSNALHNP